MTATPQTADQSAWLDHCRYQDAWITLCNGLDGQTPVDAHVVDGRVVELQIPADEALPRHVLETAIEVAGELGYEIDGAKAHAVRNAGVGDTSADGETFVYRIEGAR